MARVAALFTIVGCARHAAEPPPAPPRCETGKPAVVEERCGKVTAVWRGDCYDGSPAYASLVIEAPGAKPWQQDLLDLSTEARDPGMFSPDCRHALVLAGRMGPYHVVRVDRLAAYFAGAAPDYELAGERDPNGITGTGVFRGGGWASSSEVDYTWGCCDPPITTRFYLPTAAGAKPWSVSRLSYSRAN